MDTLTELEYKAQILGVLGDAEDGIVGSAMDRIWRMHSDKSPMSLRYHYVVLEGINLLLGDNWRNYKLRTSSGEEMDYEAPFKHLLQLADLSDKAIAIATTGPSALAASAVSVVTVRPFTSSLTPNDDRFPYPSDTKYLGNPLRRQGRGRY